MSKITRHRCFNLLATLCLLYSASLAAQWGYPPRPYAPSWGSPYAYPPAPASRRSAPEAAAAQAPAAQPAEDDYIRDAADIVGQADWERMRTVTVQLSEYRYTPNTIRLRSGVPYKMELVNRGRAKHYFTAPEFFRAIATRKVQSNRDGEIKAPYFTALEMMPNGGQLDLYFVPVRQGTFEVNCTIPGHSEQGMVGTLIID